MKIKKIPAVIGLVAVSAGVLFACYVHNSSAPDQGQVAAVVGVVNPDSTKAGLSTEPQPQLSEQRFEPPPSMGAGSYTEPAAKSESKKKASAR